MIYFFSEIQLLLNTELNRQVSLKHFNLTLLQDYQNFKNYIWITDHLFKKSRMFSLISIRVILC